MHSIRSEDKNVQRPSYDKLITYLGLGFLAAGLILAFAVFYPVLKQELFYLLSSKEPAQVIGIGESSDSDEIIEPVDTSFGIVIPRIKANARIVKNVDPMNEKIYQRALTKGVAQASGTSFPDQVGNMFLFAHSSGNFYEANRYNSVFYLLTKLTKDDEIIVFYESEPYIYKVVSQKVIEPSDTSYITRISNKKTVTLMTCWPPGTTLKRYIVVGELVEEK